MSHTTTPLFRLTGRYLFIVCLLTSGLNSLTINALSAATANDIAVLDCDNVTDAGAIQGAEIGCPDTVFDPAPITSVAPASGGSGALQYLWMQTTTDPDGGGIIQWQPIAGSTAESYDPEPITATTWYTRCARRAGCMDYVAESNVIEKTVSCCDNVVNGGTIGFDQSGCGTVFPDPLQSLTSPTGGTGAVEYLWFSSLIGPPFIQGSPNWTEISGATNAEYTPGSVDVTTYFIRCARRAGCVEFDGESNIVIITVNEIPVLDVQTTPQQCGATTNGQIDLTVTGTDTPYTFDWDNDLPAQEDQTDLAAGTYQVTVTGQNGCAAVISTEVTAPEVLLANLSSTQNACSPDPDTLTATVSGGAAPYTYTWSDAGLTNDPIQAFLPPGTYTLTVTDDVGCTATAQTTIEPGGMINLSLSVDAPACAGEQGSIGTTLSGGEPPYSYAWSNGETTAQIQNLGTGQYTLTVTDATGCAATASADIQVPGMLQILLTPENPNCADSNDGRINVTNVSGGTFPFTYAWSVPGVGNVSTLDGLGAGSYSLTVTDANGCTETVTTTLTAPDAFSITTEKQDVSCKGAADGSITVLETINGVAPISYLWGNGETTATITALVDGTYSLTVTDANGCTVTRLFDIAEPDALNLSIDAQNATCADLNDGGISATVSGGTAPYVYLWNNDVTTATMTGLAAGNYALTVTDANGCTITDNAQIDAISDISVAITATGLTCHDSADGSIELTVSGGVGDYSYNWNDGATSATRTELIGGVYAVTILDENGCAATENIIVTAPLPLQVALSTSNVVCPEDTDGSVNVSVLGGTPGYTFLWNTGATGPTLTDLGTGNYAVTVTDANGCSEAAVISVGATTTFAIAPAATNVVCHGDADGTAAANATGGLTPYTYAWSNGATTATLTAGPGNYTLTVTDAAGCSAAGNVTITEPTALTCKARMNTPVTTYNGNQGSIEVEASGGVAPYIYTWSNGASTTLVGALQAGVYTVTVTDANGCVCSSEVTLFNPSRLGNFVWQDNNENGKQDAGEPGVPNVDVLIEGTDANGPVSLNTTTDNNGLYGFDGLLPGSYKLTFSLPMNYQFTQQDQGGDETVDSDVNTTTGMTAVFNLLYDQDLPIFDAGLIQLDALVGLGDFAFYDTDRDGVQDAGEGGVGGVTVDLYRADGSYVGQQITDQNGYYYFPDLLPGSYYVIFSMNNLTGYVFSPANNGPDDLDSDAEIFTGQTAPFTLTAFSPDNRTIDVGLYRECENVIDGGTIAGNETGCGPLFDPGLIVGTIDPVGGIGNYEYLWLQSQIPVYNGPTDPNWSPAPGGTTPDYDPAPITESTFYIRCVRRNGCTEYLGESNIIEKLVNDPPLALVQNGPNGSCPGDASSFTAAIAGGGSTYQWDFGPNANVQFVSTRVVSGITFANAGTQTVTLTVTRFGCSQTATYTFEVLNCLQIFPNPAVDVVHVQLHQPTAELATLEVVNAFGEVVLQQSVPIGTQASEVFLSGLMDGSYWISVREPGQVAQRVRVVKVE